MLTEADSGRRASIQSGLLGAFCAVPRHTLVSAWPEVVRRCATPCSGCSGQSGFEGQWHAHRS